MLKELNELDADYQYYRRHKKLWRMHIIGGRKYKHVYTEELAKARLKQLRHLAGRDVADARAWLQENLTGTQQIQLLWILQGGSIDPVEEIIKYKLTDIADVCKKAFGIAPEGS